MADKTVSIKLDDQDAEKLAAIMDHYRLNKSATAVKVLIRNGYDELKGAQSPTPTKVKKNAALAPLAS